MALPCQCLHAYVLVCVVLQVLAGAAGLLKKRKVQYIMAECNTGVLGEQGGKALIEFLHDSGYEVSPQSFRGPFWDAAQIPQASCSNIALYARLRRTAVKLFGG